MAKRDWLGNFEQLVLLALLRLGPTYGMKVRQEIEDRSKRTVSIGAAYATLERMVDAGYARSWRAEQADAASDRRARRFYEITAVGEEILRGSLRGLAAMDEDLGLLGAKA